MDADAIGTIIAVIFMRLWSMWEHRKTAKEVKEIYGIMNGEFQKKIDEAKEQGRQEEREKTKPK